MKIDYLRFIFCSAETAIVRSSLYSDNFNHSHSKITIVAPNNICNGNKMNGDNGKKEIVYVITAIKDAMPNEGKMSFICAHME